MCSSTAGERFTSRVESFSAASSRLLDRTAISPSASCQGSFLFASIRIRTMQDYEKLGVFYLGKEFDLSSSQPTDHLLLYESKDLTTHAVCVGMTGSGKTGLCLSLLEEAAIDGIPVIAIDPKGDISNLLLTFPELKPADFQPWID